MHLGAAWARGGQGFYRAGLPLEALQKRGHTVVWPSSDDGHLDLDRLSRCDVVHVHRRLDAETRFVLEALERRGVPFTWDSDDGRATVTEVQPSLAEIGCGAGALAEDGPAEAWSSAGVRGRCPAADDFEHAIRVARLARVVTVPNEALARRYREAGVERIEVIPDCLPVAPRRRRPHEGIVIGWASEPGREADAEGLGLVEALERIQRIHPEVRVECVGVDLRLSERYRYRESIRSGELPAWLAGFDIGLAPFADTPFNQSRSDITLKEYAASGVPWLASPLLPYRQLGEDQGGVLVADGAWFDALDRLVRDPLERRRLATRGRSWAKTQMIDQVAGRWEAVFREAADSGRPVG